MNVILFIETAFSEPQNQTFKAFFAIIKSNQKVTQIWFSLIFEVQSYMDISLLHKN